MEKTDCRRSQLNGMCRKCARLYGDCQGTNNAVWTGCVYREVNEERRIFNHYKRDILQVANGRNEKTVRYNVIQYVCYWPKIDPVEMAAVIQNLGYEILFDDSSISAQENANHCKAVKKRAQTLSREADTWQ